jgi:hypothetical protein
LYEAKLHDFPPVERGEGDTHRHFQQHGPDPKPAAMPTSLVPQTEPTKDRKTV